MYRKHAKDKTRATDEMETARQAVEGYNALGGKRNEDKKHAGDYRQAIARGERRLGSHDDRRLTNKGYMKEARSTRMHKCGIIAQSDAAA